MPPKTLKQLSPEMRKNVLTCSNDVNVQTAIVEGMFDCMNRCDTGVSDIIEYVELDELTNDNVRMAMYGKLDDDDDEEDLEEEDIEEEVLETCVYADTDAQRLLIEEVKKNVLQAVKRKS